MHVHVLDLPRKQRLLEPDMKTSSLLAMVVAAAALASPALAGTSLAKGKKVCETAAREQTPAPKSVRTDTDRTRSNPDTLVFSLKVKNADDSVGTVTCTIDRSTDTPTLVAAQ